jgi:hypothetical protein
MKARGDERRERDAQRVAVEEVLPDEGEASLLRATSGEVLVYGEEEEKRRPVALRAVVLPDGEVVEVDERRFRRS